jgi:hypothetical protein
MCSEIDSFLNVYETVLNSRSYLNLWYFKFQKDIMHPLSVIPLQKDHCYVAILYYKQQVLKKETQGISTVFNSGVMAIKC